MNPRVRTRRVLLDARAPIAPVSWRWGVAALLCCLLMPGTSSGATRAPIAPLPGLPADTRYETVLEGGAIEGHAIDIVRLRSPRAPEALLEALSQAWRAEHGAAVVRARVGAWAVLSVRNPAGFLSVQLRALPDGASEGLIARWHTDVGAPRPRLDLVEVLPSSATALRQFSATDAGRRSSTLVAWSAEPVLRLADQLDERLRGRGLSPGGARSGGDAGIARHYRGRGLTVTVTVTPHGARSGVVLHLTEDRE